MVHPTCSKALSSICHSRDRVPADNAEPIAAVAAHTNAHRAALAAVLDRVADEVQQHLPDATRIADDDARQDVIEERTDLRHGYLAGRSVGGA